MISVFLYACLAFAAQASDGAPECPCISSTSAHSVALQSALLGAGLSKSYGATGCKAYDKNNPSVGCASNENIFCLDPWCFVDTDLCPWDRDACIAAGGKTGSNTSVYCRSRRSVASKLFSSDVPIFRYSYETCGSKNEYDPTTIKHPADGELAIAVDAWAPWVVTRTSTSGETKYGGTIFDFFAASLELFSPPASMRIIPGWSTPASRAKYSNSYTACVHDVAVGKFDLCVADLWITPERLVLAPFSIAIRHDNFYLITPVKNEEITLSSRLRRPLAPFTDSAWSMVSVFLLSVMFALVLVRLWHVYDGHLEKGWKGVCKYAARETCHTFFDIQHSFLSGGTHQGGPESLANSVIKTAVALFGLIILASYTASLASLLVVKSQAVGTVKDIEDAIEKGVKICTVTPLLGTIRGMHPRAAASGLLVEIDLQESAPRHMYAEDCTAAIVSQNGLDQIYAGMTQEKDCKKAESGDLTEAEAHCQKGFSGNARDDCQFIRMGDILLSQPVGFPVNPNIQQSMTWAFAQAQAEGVWEEKLKLNADAFPQSKCNAEEQDPEDGLTVEDLSGTLMISFAILILGLLLFVCQMCVVKSTSHKHGDLLAWFDDEPEDGEQAPKAELQDVHGEEVQHANGEQVKHVLSLKA